MSEVVTDIASVGVVEGDSVYKIGLGFKRDQDLLSECRSIFVRTSSNDRKVVSPRSICSRRRERTCPCQSGAGGGSTACWSEAQSASIAATFSAVVIDEIGRFIGVSLGNVDPMILASPPTMMRIDG